MFRALLDPLIAQLFTEKNTTLSLMVAVLFKIFFEKRLLSNVEKRKRISNILTPFEKIFFVIYMVRKLRSRFLFEGIM